MQHLCSLRVLAPPQHLPGSLSRYLTKNKVEEQTLHVFAGDVSSGLGYLALRGIVHRDVAARNVLIDSTRRAKIADFGMSRDTESGTAYYNSRSGAVPVRWSAPEALEEQKFSEKSDVWSFGVLLYELWTKAELPYKGMSNQKVMCRGSGYAMTISTCLYSRTSIRV
jgi:serine/threonine protein kinase